VFGPPLGFWRTPVSFVGGDAGEEREVAAASIVARLRFNVAVSRRGGRQLVMN
jgi:hypothetical protein